MEGIGSVTVTIAHLTMRLLLRPNEAIVQHGVVKLPTFHRREPSLERVLMVSYCGGVERH